MARQTVLSSVLTILFVGFCSACTNPEVTSKTFTTQDATIVSHIAYVSEFDVKCSSGKITSLYAELDNGNVSPVASVGTDSYQVSWTEDNKSAKSGNRVVRIFNEEGYAALRKAIRAGEDTKSVSPFFTVNVNHPGAYNGPWVKSEFIAAVASILVAYFAVTTRAKIVA